MPCCPYGSCTGRYSLPGSSPQRRLGALKGGLIYMAPDFDTPLEDFKEYME